MNRRRLLIGLASLLAALPVTDIAAQTQKKKKTQPKGKKKTMVKLTTSFGPITLELDAKAAPVTVANFLQYVKDGHYDGTVFHRVIDGFMIQGGGFTAELVQKPTRAPIKNEADNGLKNVTYSIAMARTPDPHSASSQFFINVADNAFLDYRGPTAQGFGYCVFGKVTAGQDTVERIRKVRTGIHAGMQDVPQDNVVIEKAEVLGN